MDFSWRLWIRRNRPALHFRATVLTLAACRAAALVDEVEMGGVAAEEVEWKGRAHLLSYDSRTVGGRESRVIFDLFVIEELAGGDAEALMRRDAP